MDLNNVLTVQDLSDLWKTGRSKLNVTQFALRFQQIFFSAITTDSCQKALALVASMRSTEIKRFGAKVIAKVRALFSKWFGKVNYSDVLARIASMAKKAQTELLLAASRQVKKPKAVAAEPTVNDQVGGRLQSALNLSPARRA